MWPSLSRRATCHGLITLAILTTPMFDAAAVDHETVWFGLAREFHRTPTGKAVRHVQDFDGDGDLDLVFHFLGLLAGFDCDADRVPLIGRTFAGKRIVRNGYARFGRDFAGSQDWTLAEGLSFWFYGTGSGDTLKVQVKDNRRPDPGPAGWHLLWRDEFSGPAGQPPDPRVWNHEIGDGTAHNNPGWGNSELQYYTADPANAALDGQGKLVITARAADGALLCYYGPCQYTSARLTTLGKREVGFGRVEARVRLPRGAGLWPAFWSMGTDLPQVGWPSAGEIDVMEWVGRAPTQVFGTIHGPGYSGGDSFGGVHEFGHDIAENDAHLRRGARAGRDPLVRRRHPLPSRHSGRRRPRPVGLRPSLLPAPQHGGGRELRRPRRSGHRVPADAEGGLRPRVRSRRYRRALRSAVRGRLRRLAPVDGPLLELHAQQPGSRTAPPTTASAVRRCGDTGSCCRRAARAGARCGWRAWSWRRPMTSP